MAKHRKHPYMGREMTVRELSKLPECVVSSKIISQRLHRGFSVYDAISLPVQDRKKRFVKWKDEMVSLPKLVREEAVEGIGYYHVVNRLNSGWSIERALFTPKKFNRVTGGKHRYDYFGKQLTIMELSCLPCCVVGINTLRSRLEILHWDVYDALVLPSRYNASEDRLSPEERQYWNRWLAMPIDMIKKRAEEFWLKEEYMRRQ